MTYCRHFSAAGGLMQRVATDKGFPAPAETWKGAIEAGQGNRILLSLP